jgi:hypothetical protein
MPKSLEASFEVWCGQLTGFASFKWLTQHIGVTAPMASITLVRTVSFSIYQRAKYSYSAWVKRNLGFDIIGHVNRHGTYPNIYSVACFGAAGATAGSCITFLACPFELTKLSAQVSVLLAERGGSKGSHSVAASYQNKGTLRTMANIIKHRGIFGLYTGLSLHLRTWPLQALQLLALTHGIYSS